MKRIKTFQIFESARFDENKLEKFLERFPENATKWWQATDELSDVYAWITSAYNEQHEDEPEKHLKSIGRDNCKTPSEWNTKYKMAIREGIKKLSPRQKDDLFAFFGFLNK